MINNGIDVENDEDEYLSDSFEEIPGKATEAEESSFLQSQAHQTGKTTHPFHFNSHNANIVNVQQEQNYHGTTDIDSNGASSTTFTDLRHYCPNYKVSPSLFTATNRMRLTTSIPPSRSLQMANSTLSESSSTFNEIRILPHDDAHQGLSNEEDSIKDNTNKKSHSKWRCSRCSFMNLVDSRRCTCCLYLNDDKTTNLFD